MVRSIILVSIASLVISISCLRREKTEEKEEYKSHQTIELELREYYKKNIDSIMSVLCVDKVELLGSINSKYVQALLLFGESNEDTYTEQYLRIFPLKTGFIDDSLTAWKFSLPGNTYNSLDSIVRVSKVYFGECSKKYSETVVWYQQEIDTTQNWINSLFVLDLRNGQNYLLQEDNMDGLLTEILKNIESGKCQELSGFNIFIDP